MDSDNEAMQLVFENTGNEILERTFNDLGIIIGGVADLDDYVSVKEYSSCFRLLYNATYLNKTCLAGRHSGMASLPVCAPA
ncbi:MAG TPA: hypothetical protein VNJ07_05995 [Chitinophagales bacterium]|nr:hypothetical protein [Chitinophagales bacterium]